MLCWSFSFHSKDWSLFNGNATHVLVSVEEILKDISDNKERNQSGTWHDFYTNMLHLYANGVLKLMYIFSNKGMTLNLYTGIFEYIFSWCYTVTSFHFTYCSFSPSCFIIIYANPLTPCIIFVGKVACLRETVVLFLNMWTESLKRYKSNFNRTGIETLQG